MTTEKMKTIKIEARVHQRLTNYRAQLQGKRNAFTTFGDAIDEALEAAADLKALKEEP